MNPLVSILMPAKNSATFLADCLQSVINQTESDWELIAINDHSTDESGQILADFAARDERIKVFTNEGEGIILALRLAFSKSEGELITRMDSDDLMPPKKLEILSQNLRSAGSGNIALGLVEYFAAEPLGKGYKNYEQWLNKLIEKGASFDEIYKECPIPSPCWMVYRKDLENCGAFKSDKYPEDYDLAFRFYEGGLKCLPANQVLHRWRDYSSRTSRISTNYKDNLFLDLKLHYFLKLNRDEKRPLVIWGAGRKGKVIAQKLSTLKHPFSWVCNNPQKIGQRIHNCTLEDISSIESYNNPQIIIVVAGPDDQQQIQDQLHQKSLKPMIDYFFFC
ncbi:glycosyltransferase family 2 protein [Candidatus Peregrinibacteria bacterium]|jgi:glycosyltransferase involved in cell wall biosynthesis|nr:glycosyltransferase family 2 protein [Candidatus Peregrinibacteria bacterium]MBT7703760.1 glycosyltransferase family 2 protein [Candidatus Peregrinibacteria bacterium]